jgi:hypothetical protein
MINIFDVIQKEYNSLSIFDMNYKISYEDINNIRVNLLHELGSTCFCPKKIFDYASSCNKYIKISSEHITLHLIYKGILKESIYKLLRTIKQCTIIKKHYELYKHFDIFIVFSPYKRYIVANRPIDTIHINGGSTATNDNKIFIIRHEEYAKVILHELIHHVKQIHNDDWSVNNIQKLKETFNISPDTLLIPNEAIVELWATIYYIIFLSLEYKIPFNILIKKELEYSFIQSNKIIKKQQNRLWIEHTNAFCYIIFKTILLKAFIEKGILLLDPNDITEYLIKNNLLPYIIKLKDTDKSLRMMSLSDL